MAAQVNMLELRSRVPNLSGQFWFFLAATAFLSILDFVSVTLERGLTSALWSTILLALLGVAAGICPGIGGGLLVATCGLVQLLPEQIADSRAILKLGYLVLALWASRRRCLLFGTGVMVLRGAVFASFPSVSAFVESALITVLLCGTSGYLIGEYQRRGDRMAQRVHVLELEQQLAESRIRATLGADLHDTVATDLTQIVLRCQIAAGNRQSSAAVMSEIENDARVALQHVRTVVAVLRPATDKSLRRDLRAAADECAELLRAHGFDVDIETEKTVSEERSAATDDELLGLVLREATVNIIKYAADKGDVNITLSLTDQGNRHP
ncbi:hypothetical protein CWT12_07955 [Actinomyces sp. 432]|uniref:sensor histidine kinase n=1 Tax=Actinomyces sp. 432 TaxID=2057798 RepID=UPI0013746544|nr:histidine kinase [Actinomyces sp. 432]QHO91259.1 hypothetical protein CWT12_07955 [Actinomyces sp. 432]